VLHFDSKLFNPMKDVVKVDNHLVRELKEFTYEPDKGLLVPHWFRVKVNRYVPGRTMSLW